MSSLTYETRPTYRPARPQVKIMRNEVIERVGYVVHSNIVVKLFICRVNDLANDLIFDLRSLY